MGKHLDIDDVCAGHPEAMRELARLRDRCIKLDDLSRVLAEENLEVEALKHDIARCQEANAELATENERLRAKLAETRK